MLIVVLEVPQGKGQVLEDTSLYIYHTTPTMYSETKTTDNREAGQ